MTTARNHAAERLRFALDMHETGVALMRQNLRRRHPDWSEAQIDERLAEWLATRPGADFGDCPGAQRALER
jgi:hypothetical protein